jgi:hypothetical protein
VHRRKHAGQADRLALGKDGPDGVAADRHVSDGRSGNEPSINLGRV